MEYRQQKFYTLLTVGIFLFSQTLCGCRLNGRNSTPAGSPVPAVRQDTAFRMQPSAGGKPQPYIPPSIPAVLTEIQERYDYLAVHYWDRFPMNDTSYIGCPEVTEQALADYLYFLPEVSPAVAEEGLGILIGKALEGNKPMFYHFSELLERYLYDPNSPMRNEELYIGLLRSITSLPGLDAADKYRPSWQLEMALKNRPGEKAAGFGYILRDGSRGHLDGFAAEYTLLLFFNPDCPACDEVIANLKQSALLSEALKDRTHFRVLAIYADQDPELWEKHKGDLPGSWDTGYNFPRDIIPGELYDLRAMPALYLLDKKKRVILKDAAPEEVERWFNAQQ